MRCTEAEREGGSKDNFKENFDGGICLPMNAVDSFGQL